MGGFGIGWGIVNEIKRLGLDLIGVIMNDVRGEGGLVARNEQEFFGRFFSGGGVYI